MYWFLTKNKQFRTSAAGRRLVDRRGKVLFIDALNLGYMKDRVLRDFTQDGTLLPKLLSGELSPTQTEVT